MPEFCADVIEYQVREVVLNDEVADGTSHDVWVQVQPVYFGSSFTEDVGFYPELGLGDL